MRPFTGSPEAVNYHGPGERAETLDYVFMVELVHSLGLALDTVCACRVRCGGIHGQLIPQPRHK